MSLDRNSPPASEQANALADTRRNIVSTKEEFRAQAVAVARHAERNLVIYTGRLESEIFEYPAFVEAVKRLVLARPFARVRILVAEPHELSIRHALMAIAVRLPSMVDVRVMPADQYDASGFIVADDCGVVYRMHCTRWDGIAELNDPPIAGMYLGRFEHIWAASEPLALDDAESQSA